MQRKLFATVLVLAASFASAATLTRAPYIQLVTPNSALVAFRTDVSCTPTVKLGKEGAVRAPVSAPAATKHAVPLAGLEPGTSYQYEIDACGAKSGPFTFKTAPPLGTRSVKFATVGDFGTGGTAQAQVFAKVLAYQPEFLLTLGDNAYDSGTETEFQNRLFTPMKDVLARIPAFASLGNHEYVTSQGQPYLDNFFLPQNNPKATERYYSFDWGHVHFVALDSQCLLGAALSTKCTLADQKAWLAQDLAATKQPWKVVYFHHPTWSSGDHGSYPGLQREISPLLEQYGVDLVLTGHDHNYERTVPMKGTAAAAAGQKGIPYLVVGSGGAGLRGFDTSKPSWSAFRDDGTYGFLEVEVVGGTLSARLRTTAGGVLDSFTLTKTLPPEPAAEGTLAIEPPSGVAPLSVNVALTTQNMESPVTTWTFGDGATAQGSTASHTFTQAGTFTVTGRATSGTKTVTKTATVTVSAPQVVTPPDAGQPEPPDAGSAGVPDAGFSGEPDAGTVSEPVTAPDADAGPQEPAESEMPMPWEPGPQPDGTDLGTPNAGCGATENGVAALGLLAVAGLVAWSRKPHRAPVRARRRRR